MLTHSLRLFGIFATRHINRYFFPLTRNVQISVIGAANDVGSNVSLLLKMNPKVKCLQLYDDDAKVKGIGMELAHIPGGPVVSVFSGCSQLDSSIHGSHIVLVSCKPCQSLKTNDELLAANAPAVLQLCKAIVDYNPDAFLALATHPLNNIVPLASSILSKFGCFNPYKTLGVTQIDIARSRSLVGNIFQVDPKSIIVPVIGGSSEETMVPLFSNINPSCYTLNFGQINTCTRLLRKAGIEVMQQKQYKDSSVLAMAWSINEFLDGLINAVYGSEIVLNCFTLNPTYGTKFFSGPTTLGCSGIVQTCCGLTLSDNESKLLEKAVPVLIQDVERGEEYATYITSLGKF